MKAGQLFWGFLFLTLGGFFLLVKFDIFVVDFSYAWDLWPVTIILLGILIIVKKTVVKPFVASAFGIFVGYLIFGSLYSIVDNNIHIDWDNDHGRYHDVKYFTEPYMSEIEYAKLDLATGAGTFLIKNNTENLFEGMAKGNLTHKYSFSTDFQDDEAFIDLDLRKNNWHIFEERIRNKLGIKLNENPVWDLKLNIGAARADFDLSDFKVRSLELNTGATDTDIVIGDKYDFVEIDVEMGAASLVIDIPKESGCRIKGEMVLFSKSLEDFEKVNSDYYVTSNYESATNKIDIKIDGGVSQFSIRRF